MTTSGTARHPDWRPDLGWGDLRREPAYRTSDPTYEVMKKARSLVGEERQGPSPFYDTVVFAALRLAVRDPESLAAECDRIESERHSGRIARSKRDAATE